MPSSFSFHHIGMACFDIGRTSAYYMVMGYQKTETTVDPLQNVKVCVLRKFGFPTIELLEPVDGNSPVINILRKSGVTPYHLCYEVPDMKSAMTELKGRRFIPLDRPKWSNVFLRKICFLFNRDVGIIEIIENNKKSTKQS